MEPLWIAWRGPTDLEVSNLLGRDDLIANEMQADQLWTLVIVEMTPGRIPTIARNSGSLDA